MMEAGMSCTGGPGPVECEALNNRAKFYSIWHHLFHVSVKPEEWQTTFKM